MMMSGKKCAMALMVGVLIFLLICTACTNAEHKIFYERPVKSKSEVITISEKPVKYIDAIAAYNELLFHGGTWRLENASVSISPNRSTKYALRDLNDDGIPELLVNRYIERIVYDDDGGLYTPFSSTIFSYKNGAIYAWFDGCKEGFELLNNGAILQVYLSNDATTNVYEYLTIEDIENERYCLIGEEVSEPDGSIGYRINYLSVTEEEWNEVAEAYFNLPYDELSWTYYDWNNVRWPGVQDVRVGNGSKDESRDIECGEGYTATIFKRPESQHDLLLYEITLGKDNSSYSLVVRCNDGINTVAVFDSANNQLQEFTVQPRRVGGEIIHYSNADLGNIVDFIDANLDGYVDLTIKVSGISNAEQALLLWNPSTRGFDRVISSEPLFYFEVYEGYIKNWARLNQTTTDVQIFTWESDHVLKLDSNERIVLE